MVHETLGERTCSEAADRGKASPQHLDSTFLDESAKGVSTLWRCEAANLRRLSLLYSFYLQSLLIKLHLRCDSSSPQKRSGGLCGASLRHRRFSRLLTLISPSERSVVQVLHSPLPYAASGSSPATILIQHLFSAALYNVVYGCESSIVTQSPAECWSELRTKPGPLTQGLLGWPSRGID